MRRLLTKKEFYQAVEFRPLYGRRLDGSTVCLAPYGSDLKAIEKLWVSLKRRWQEASGNFGDDCPVYLTGTAHFIQNKEYRSTM
ncbi:MAG: transposase [Azonexus sp.]|jgi:hypothetical protein|nr:transposase [Azonexus sp.]